MATGGGGGGGGDVDRLFAGESAELTTSDAPAVLLVLDTRRVLLGDELRDFVCAAGEASSSPFVYDVVMMDGAQKAVFTLHPDLSALVEAGIVRKGQEVHVVRARRLIDPSSKYLRQAVLVLQLRVGAFNVEVASTGTRDVLGQRPWHPLSVHDDRPALPGSIHYLPSLWPDDAMATVATWAHNRRALPRVRLVPDVSADGVPPVGDDGIEQIGVPPGGALPSIKAVTAAALQRRDGAVDRRAAPPAAGDDAAAGGGANAVDGADGAGPSRGAGAAPGATSAPRLLVGRLTAVGRIHHWGSAKVKNRLPFKTTVRIQDATRSIDLVLWGGVAMSYHEAFARLPLGTPVLVRAERSLTVRVVDVGGSGGSRLEVPVNTTPRVDLFVVDEATLATAGIGGRLPHPNMRVTPLAAVAAVPDGAALSVVGVITRVGPVLRSAAYDVDFDAAAPQPSFGSADGDGAPAGGGGGGARRAGDADVDAVARLMSKLSGPGALGRGAGGTVWSMHRFVWLRDGSGDGPDVAVKVFPNSRVAAFSSLAPDMLFMATHVRMVAPIDGEVAAAHSGDGGDVPAAPHRPFYVTTSQYSALAVGAAPGPAVAAGVRGPRVFASPLAIADATVDAAVAWAASQHAQLQRLSPGGQCLLLPPSVSTTRASSSLVRPPTLAAYGTLFMWGVVQQQSQRGGGGGADDVGAVGAGGGGVPPFVSLRELTALVHGTAEFKRAAVSACGGGTRGGALGVDDTAATADAALAVASAATGSRPAARGPLPVTSVAALLARHVPLANRHHLRVVVHARIERVDPVPAPGAAARAVIATETAAVAAAVTKAPAKTRGRAGGKTTAPTAAPAAARAASRSASQPPARRVRLELKGLALWTSSASKTRRRASSLRTSRVSQRAVPLAVDDEGGDTDGGAPAAMPLAAKATKAAKAAKAAPVRGGAPAAKAPAAAAITAKGRKPPLKGSGKSGGKPAAAASGKAVAKGAKAGGKRSAEPPAVVDEGAAALRTLVRSLHEELGADVAADDDGVGVACVAAAPAGGGGKRKKVVAAAGATTAEAAPPARAPHPACLLTLSDVNDAGSLFTVLMHPSALLPHASPLPPTGDAALDLLRSFLPPTAPAAAADIFATYFRRRRFAVCVAVHQRSWDASIDMATGAAVAVGSDAAAAAESAGTLLRAEGDRLATVRVEAIYDLDEDGGGEDGGGDGAGSVEL